MIEENGIQRADRDAGEGSRTSAAPLLTLRGLTKSFSGALAVDGVDLDVYAGTVHAIVGENGAGKSTLCRMIAGLLTPDEGEIVLDGEQVSFHGPASARNVGISFVPQELSIVPELSLAENIEMGKLPSQLGFVSRSALRRRCRAILERLSLDLDPRAPAGSFGPGIQQLIMVARGLSIDAKLFILDEPTAALTDSEVDRLFNVIELTKASGAAFLYISHRLQELERVADELTVLRDGKWVLTRPVHSVSRHEIIRAMVGRQIERFFETGEGIDDGERGEGAPVRGPGREERAPALEVEGLTAGLLQDISFSVDAGSIVGLAGLLGAGRSEVLRCIFGIDRIESGRIALNGRPLEIRSPRDAIRHGIVLVPEERKSEGLVLNLSIADNVAAPQLRSFAHGTWLLNGRVRAAAKSVVAQLAIKTPNVDLPVESLSGGNQQKVVIGKWIYATGQVYLLDEPTRGVDIGAKVDIYAAVRELTRTGAAVLVVSSELPELIGLCDRILVMREGRLVAEFPSIEFSEERILAAAMGHEAVAVA